MSFRLASPLGILIELNITTESALFLRPPLIIQDPVYFLFGFNLPFIEKLFLCVSKFTACGCFINHFFVL